MGCCNSNLLISHSMVTLLPGDLLASLAYEQPQIQLWEKPADCGLSLMDESPLKHLRCPAEGHVVPRRKLTASGGSDTTVIESVPHSEIGGEGVGCDPVGKVQSHDHLDSHLRGS